MSAGALVAFAGLTSAGDSPIGAGQAAAAGPSSCPRVVVIGVRGSGQSWGYGQPVWDVVDNVLPEMRDRRVHRFALDYPATKSVVDFVGAFGQLSGPGLGAYHDSVNAGKRGLRALLTTWMNTCDPAATRIVLVGYSQGAQVAADVYQEIQRSNSRADEWFGGLVLFGDPYFNPGSPGAVVSSGFSRERWGSLGLRSRFGRGDATDIRSYCHFRDPICQGNGSFVRFSSADHSNYDLTGEAADAGRWLSTKLRAWIRATPWPPAAGTIVRNPANGASWLMTSRGTRNWIPTGGDWICLRGRGAKLVNVKQIVIDRIPDEVGTHATCSTAVAPGGDPSVDSPADDQQSAGPTAANLIAVDHGGGHVGVAFDVGWQPGRDPVTCHFFRNGLEIFTAQCGTRSSKQFYGLPPGRHTFHATVSDAFGVSSGPTNSATVDVAPPPVPAAAVGDRLSNDGRLNAASNDYLSSSDGRYRLVMQQDGNLVLYGPAARPIWATGTVGRGADHLRMQGDGNLVIYNGANAPVWATNTPRRYSAHLVVQNDGNVVIYNDGSPIWATNTAGRT